MTQKNPKPSKISQRWRSFSSWLIPLLILLWLLGQRLPLWWSHWSLEGTSILNYRVVDEHGTEFNFPVGEGQKRVIIFWASWCAPCKLELKRFQASLDSGALPAGSVQTVAVWDETEKVTAFIKEKGYTFPVYFTSDPEILKAYQVQATPTVALLDEQNKIHWISSGVSPLGVYRAEHFINP